MPKKGKEPNPKPSGSGVTKRAMKKVLKKKGTPSAKIVQMGKEAAKGAEGTAEPIPGGEGAAQDVATKKGTEKSLGLKSGQQKDGQKPTHSFKSPKRIYDRFLTYELDVDPNIKKYKPIREVRIIRHTCNTLFSEN